MKGKYLYLVILIFMGCQETDNVVVNIFKPHEITYKELKQKGFEPVVFNIDEPVIKKDFGDSIITYQFDDDFSDNSTPSMMSFQYDLSTTNIDSILSSLQEFKVIVPCNQIIEDRKEFYLYNPKTHLYYSCSLDKNEPSLGITRVTVNYIFPNHSRTFSQ